MATEEPNVVVSLLKVAILALLCCFMFPPDIMHMCSLFEWISECSLHLRVVLSSYLEFSLSMITPSLSCQFWNPSPILFIFFHETWLSSLSSLLPIKCSKPPQHLAVQGRMAAIFTWSIIDVYMLHMMEKRDRKQGCQRAVSIIFRHRHENH